MEGSFGFLYKTRGNAAPAGKPRVYFTCHPEDFERSFEKICADLFASHDCAVYYTEDMGAEIPAENREADLERMNLFVIPVTFRLLTQPNRAMDSDFRFARERNIPVLPILMESGMNEYYSAPDKFGQLQYLDPYSGDSTEIAYAEKLKKYLEAVLVSDETAKQIRAAFDAYIFLSYRKKDRRLANALLREIHSRPALRDIAVWYDEFLTPGESFKDNIDRIMQNSRLFTLLVTPNLLEEPGGKPNFVMGEEYPAAQRAGMRILPAEMEPTDRELLAEKYAGLPQCLHTDEEAFFQTVIEAAHGLENRGNNDDPVHNYLIGLAYLEGIDVETDRKRGLSMITAAAEAGLLTAQNKLYKMSCSGAFGAESAKKELYWARKSVERCKECFGETHPETLTAMNNLAVSLSDRGELSEALALLEKVCEISKQIFGEDHPETLSCRHNLAWAYAEAGVSDKGLPLLEQVWAARCSILGEKHPDTLVSLNGLARGFYLAGSFEKARELYEKLYALRCEVFGEEDSATLGALSSLAVVLGRLGEREKEAAVEKKICLIWSRTLGQAHPQTLRAMNNLAATHIEAGEFDKAGALLKKTYTQCVQLYGEAHPNTLGVMHNLAALLRETGDRKTAIRLAAKCYEIRCRLQGETHRETLAALLLLAEMYGAFGFPEKERAMKVKAYRISRTVKGELHPDTVDLLDDIVLAYNNGKDPEKELAWKKEQYRVYIAAFGEEDENTLAVLNNLAVAYGRNGNYAEEVRLGETVCALRRRILGETHPKTVTSKNNLAVAYGNAGETEKGLALMQEVYKTRCEILGEEHPDTVSSLESIAASLINSGDTEQGPELLEKVYFLNCKLLGWNHPSAAENRKDLSAVYEKYDLFERELDMAERVYLTRLQQQGENDEGTKDAFYALVSVLWMRNMERHPAMQAVMQNPAAVSPDVAAARKPLINVYSYTHRLLSRGGAEQEPALTAFDWLAYCYYTAGEYQQAARLWSESLETRRRLNGEADEKTRMTQRCLQTVLLF